MVKIHPVITLPDLHRARTEYKLGRPYSKIYEYTYGYSMNYYQPMIDYLDKRDSGHKPSQLPHLPWTNERYIEDYLPDKKIQSYDNKTVNSMAHKYQNAALKNINKFDVKKHYYGSMVAPGLTKLKRTLPKSYSLSEMQTRDINKIKAEIDELEKNTYNEYKERQKVLEEYEKDFSGRVKFALKGKSAKHISNILLSEVANKKDY